MLPSPPGYRCIAELATGGMGTLALVLRRHGTFERLLVCKRVRDGGDADNDGMLLEEARIAGRVRHANVVSVVDAGVDAHGPYIIMSYVHGLALGELVVAASNRDALIPVQVCLRIMAQVARGLHAAHEVCDGDNTPMGLVHRDVSPQNVLVGADGVVRLADFGIAKEVHSGSQTRTGLLKGKPGYMAPEQLRFEPLDRRTDLYSLGVVLFETLAGRRLHTSRDMTAVARAVLNDPPPDVCDERADVPPGVNELLFRLLAKHPAHRPDTADEIADALQAEADDMALDEGAMDVGAFLARHHGEPLAARRGRVETAMTNNRVETALANEPVETVVDDEHVKTLMDTDAVETVPLRWHARWPRRAMAIAAAAAVGLAAWGVSQPPEPKLAIRGLIPSVVRLPAAALETQEPADVRRPAEVVYTQTTAQALVAPAPSKRVVKPLPSMWDY